MDIGKMARLLAFLLLSCLLPAGLSSPERGPPVDTLDKDVLFEISWPGSTMGAIAGFGESMMEGHLQEEPLEEGVGPLDEGAGAVEELPNFLLLSGWEEHPTPPGPIVMMTPNHERYKCVVPQLTEESSEDQDAEDLELLPEALLAPLMGQCTKLVMGYWAYELCHGQYLRQYHEDKNAPEGKKLTEYYLGNAALARDLPTAAEGGAGRGGTAGEVEAGEQKKKKEVPVWYFNGQDYPYHAMEMGGGTPCDLLNSDPRSTSVMYICESVAHPTGSFLHIEEVTTCKYLAVIATTQLCQNEAYTFKESPVHTIQCYPQKDAPRRPRILLEHELMFLHAKQSSQKPSDSASPPPKTTQQQTKQSTPIDTSFIESFLKGDMCLRGGSGWWQHEVCFKQYVKQMHFESNKAKVEVLLGSWDEAAHREWFSQAGKKKRSQNHVTHMYTGGDICDITHTARTCQVRFKCIQAGVSKGGGISLYLEEPTPCTYSLTVEGNFVCPLLLTADEFGVFQLQSQEAQTSDTDGVDRDGDTDSS